MTVTEFAKQLNASRVHISKISNKAIKPGKYLAFLIEQLTHGEVTAAELLSDDQTSAK